LIFWDSKVRVAGYLWVMARILGLDIGGLRTGIAETDPSGSMAFPVETVATAQLMDWLKHKLHAESIAVVVVGYPTDLRGRPTDATPLVERWEVLLKQQFPALQLVRIDERLTSAMASAALVAGGVKKKDRQAKGARDAVSAALILDSYLKQRG
jgi:putative Holliday junction resolvase